MFMPKPLHILIVEDSEDDALLLTRELRRGGYDLASERVDNPEDMRAALRRQPWDLVVSDYVMPKFSGLAALAMIQESGLDIPFIIVSGNIGEDIAVGAMRAGAQDYIIKGNLARLLPAVGRELREAEVRKERKRATHDLQASELQYRLLFENSLDAVLLMTPDGTFLSANSAACHMLGMSEEEILASGKYAILDPADSRVRTLTEERQRTGRTRGEVTLIRKDGAKIACELSSAFFTDKDGNARVSIIARDITDRKKAEENISRLNRLYAVLSQVNEAIVRTSGAQALYEHVCRIVVEKGLFKMAWVGLLDEETRRVGVAASHGDDGGYLKDIAIIADNVPEGNGPTGRAVVEKKHIICADIEHDPIMRPWRDKALRHGFRSSAAFPLHSEARVIGALTVYAGTAQFFTEEEISLLTSLAADISFALDTLANEKKRREAEQRTEVTNALLSLFTRKIDRKEYLEAAIQLLREWSGFRHIGIRIIDRNNTLPFEACYGYNAGFLETEARLSLTGDRCICTRIALDAMAPPDARAMTPKGSFFSNDSRKFVAGLDAQDRGSYRGHCMQNGYVSLVVIPIRYSDRVIGAIHLADERAGMASLLKVEFLEHLAHILGEAILRFSMEDDLRRNYADLQRTSELLERIFSTTHMLIAYLDRDLNFIRVNRAYAEAEARDPGYFAGRNYFELCPDEELKPIFRKVVETGEPAYAEERPFHYAGAYTGDVSFWDWSLVPVRTDDGGVSGLVLTLVDVTGRMKAEEELRRTAAYTRTLIEASLDPLVTIGPDGRITDANAAAEMATGRLRGELIGTDFSRYFTDPAKAEAGYQQVFREGKVQDYSLEIRHRGGSVTPVLYNASVYRDEAGNVLGVFASARDITALRKAEEERARLASAVEASADAVVITDPASGIIAYVNPAFEQITGYRREEAIGRSLHFLDSGRHDEEFYKTLRETLRREGVWRGHLMSKKKDGSVYFEDCTFSPVKDESGTIINFVSVKRDVTEKLRLESIAESVNTMRNIGYVFSGVRHEIGNPINSVKMILTLLQHKLDAAPKDVIRGYVDRSLGELGRVEHLLKSLKNYNLYETPELENLNMPRFLEKFLDLAIEDFRKKGIAITWSCEPGVEWAIADPRALQQVLLNILTNAADALAAREAPAIALHLSRKYGQVLLQVSDNGCGMTEKQLADLFKPFYTSKPQGTGLGLVLVKKMLTKMNGDIEIASSPDQGTTVSITLPEGTHAA